MKTVLINFFSTTEYATQNATEKVSVFLRNGYPLYSVTSLACGDEKGFYQAVVNAKDNGYKFADQN